MYGKKQRRSGAEVNSGSMADIAFLLLIFFLVTTTINSEKGIAMLLPRLDNQPEQPVKERNVLNIQLNSANQILVDGELSQISEIGRLSQTFITNNGQNPNLSESPRKAVISLKADRGTSYNDYLQVLDAVKSTYNQLRAQSVGLTLQQFAQLDLQKPADRQIFERAKENFPMMISEANPSDVN